MGREDSDPGHYLKQLRLPPNLVAVLCGSALEVSVCIAALVALAEQQAVSSFNWLSRCSYPWLGDTWKCICQLDCSDKPNYRLLRELPPRT